jgi:hypothetical protein
MSRCVPWSATHSREATSPAPSRSAMRCRDVVARAPSYSLISPSPHAAPRAP